MKKIFYILASAIVALGAVACQNEVDENINPNDTKEITFNVSFDESTRIAGDITNGTATFEFEGDETLKVGDAVLTQESAGVFTADAENSAKLNDLVGDTVTATVEDLGNGLKFASEEITLIAGENNITLSLACPALYFVVPAMTANVNLTIGEETIWFDKTPDVKDFFRGIEGTEVYIKHAIGTEVVKETTLRNLENKVYNLGTLDTDMTVANVAALIEKAAAGSTIKLPAGATITGSEILTINKDITIDGNGATFTSTAARAINIETTGEVNISNLTVECSGERVFNIINKPATVNISDVTATASNYAIMVATSAGAATVNVENSTLTGLNVVNIAGEGAQVTITKCELNCEDNNPAEGYGVMCFFYTANEAKITATDCDINITGTAATDTVAAYNCSMTGIIDFNGEVVKAIAYIAYDNSTAYGFSTLEEAIETAEGDDVIVLLQDAEIAQAGTFNIYVNGCTLTAAEGYKIESIDEENNTVTVVKYSAQIKGSFDSWGNGIYMFPEGDYHVAKNVNFTSTVSVKFVTTNWVGGPATAEIDVLCKAQLDGGNNISVAKGTYDIYLKNDNSEFYIVNTGKAFTGAGSWKLYGDKAISGIKTGWNTSSYLPMYKGVDGQYYITITFTATPYFRLFKGNGGTTDTERSADGGADQEVTTQGKQMYWGNSGKAFYISTTATNENPVTKTIGFNGNYIWLQ